MLVVRRFAGEWSRPHWTVGVLGVVLLALGANAMETFWNPYLEASAVLLMMVLTAAAISGSGLSVMGVAVVGSYVVQTDVGTVPIVGVMAVGAVIGYLVRLVMRPRGRHGRGARRRRWAPVVFSALGVAVLAVAWLPPLAQQFRGHPGTCRPSTTSSPTRPPRRNTGPTHTFKAAWAVVANATTAVPWGNVSATASMTTAAAGRQQMLGVWAGLAVVGLVWAGWRRHWFAFGLSLTTLVGLAVSVLAVERIVGSIGDYLAFWMELLPVPAVAALGVLAVTASRRKTNWSTTSEGPPTSTRWWRLVAGWTMAAVLVLPVRAGRLAVGAGFGAGVDSPGNLEIGQLTAFTVAHLRQASETDVLVVMGNADRWPEASGLVLQLSQDGYHPTVTSTWGFMFTPRYVARSAAQAQVVLTDGIPGAPPVGTGLSARRSRSATCPPPPLSCPPAHPSG